MKSLLVKACNLRPQPIQPTITVTFTFLQIKRSNPISESLKTSSVINSTLINLLFEKKIQTEWIVFLLLVPSQRNGEVSRFLFSRIHFQKHPISNLQMINHELFFLIEKVSRNFHKYLTTDVYSFVSWNYLDFFSTTFLTMRFVLNCSKEKRDDISFLLSGNIIVQRKLSNNSIAEINSQLVASSLQTFILRQRNFFHS